MSKSAIVQARINPDLKAKADSVFQSLGINATAAINLFYSQIVRHQGIPLELKAPNSETLKAMDEVQDSEFRDKSPRFTSAKDLLDSID